MGGQYLGKIELIIPGLLLQKGSQNHLCLPWPLSPGENIHFRLEPLLILPETRPVVLQKGHGFAAVSSPRLHPDPLHERCAIIRV